MSQNSYKVTELRQIGNAVQWLVETVEKGLAGGTVLITLGREGRSTPQNSLLWALLTDISNQVEWYGSNHSPEVWKDLITGTFRQCKVLPNLDSTGFVMTGLSTSKMSKADFSALVEYIHAFGAEKQISWSDPSLAVFAEYREAQA